MDITSDLDTVHVAIQPGERGLMGGIAAFGTLFASIGLAFLAAYFSPALTEPAFGFLGPIFILVSAVPTVLGWMGLGVAMRRIEVRLELHEVHVQTWYAGVSTQQFTVGLSELDRVEVTPEALVLAGPNTSHTISMSYVHEDDRTALAELLDEAVRQRDAETRQAPCELLDLVRRRTAAQRVG